MKILSGVVCKISGDKTISVSIKKVKLDKKYKKYIKVVKKVLAHDEKRKFIKGDIVRLTNSRPISKRKSFVALYD